ncbi:MAG: MOP flippase family protein [Saprospiraceae bacterium]
MSLRQSFIAGIRWTSLASFVSVALGIIQVAILARYLEKSDFAWVAIAGIFINTATQLQFAGVNAALIQQPQNTPTALSSLYWLNISIGVLLFIIITIFAPVLAEIYNNNVLISITITYAVTLLLQSFSVQYKALLQKELQFNILSTGELAGTLAGFMLTCWAALQGWGAFALVAGYLTRSMVETSIIISRGRYLFRPDFTFQYHTIQPYLVFSRFHWAERILVQIGGQLDLLIIGKLLGSEALGVYDLFKRTLVRPFTLISDIIEKITFPTLVKLQTNVIKQKSIYFQLLTYLSTINLPIIISLIIAAEPIIHIYFGADWVEYTIIFQLLCIFCIFHYVLNPADVLLLAQNKIKYWLLSNIYLIPLQVFMLIVGTEWGLYGAAVANVITFAIFTLVVYNWLLLPSLHSNVTEWLATLRMPFFIALFSIILPIFLLFLSAYTINALILFLIFIIIYGLFTVIFNKDFIMLIRQFIRK